MFLVLLGILFGIKNQEQKELQKLIRWDKITAFSYV